jgi:hypothetical protein
MWSDSIAPMCDQFSLVSRINDNGDPICSSSLKSLTASFNAPAAGCLWLSFNDGVNFTDNSGVWTVQVDVTTP